MKIIVLGTLIGMMMPYAAQAENVGINSATFAAALRTMENTTMNCEIYSGGVTSYNLEGTYSVSEDPAELSVSAQLKGPGDTLYGASYSFMQLSQVSNLNIPGPKYWRNDNSANDSYSFFDPLAGRATITFDKSLPKAGRVYFYNKYKASLSCTF